MYRTICSSRSHLMHSTTNSGRSHLMYSTTDSGRSYVMYSTTCSNRSHLMYSITNSVKAICDVQHHLYRQIPPDVRVQYYKFRQVQMWRKKKKCRQNTSIITVHRGLFLCYSEGIREVRSRLGFVEKFEHSVDSAYPETRAKAQCAIREYHTIYLIIFGVLKGQFHKNYISLRLLWHTIHRYWAGCETELAVCKYQKKLFFRIHVRY
jgi:hypothetical protein